MTPQLTAAGQWAAELAAWTIDAEILAAAPESPYGHPPELFRVDTTRPTDTDAGSPLLAKAREALPRGGSVLDVGVGGGAASLPLVPPAARLVVVDEALPMLDEVATALRRSDTNPTPDLRSHLGRWPGVADDVEQCDVVVCSHVFYNTADLPDVARALDAHARRRVVVELTARHPWTGLGPLWQHFHHQPRPDGPSADLAVAVLRELGIDPNVERWSRPAPDRDGPQQAAYVALTRRRLCLPVSREPEVAALMAEQPATPRESVVLWWDTEL